MNFEPTLAIIIPCYNEEENIKSTAFILLNIINKLAEEHFIDKNSFLFFVDDGSYDKTWELIDDLNNKSPQVKGIKFCKNFGNQKAILAGLSEAKKYNADCFITIDADLQQDETKIKEFVQKYKDGFEIVQRIRNDRNTDKFFKKYSALAFYKFMNILGVNIKINNSDYRLIGRKALNSLENFKETNLFLRGIFYELGYKTSYVYFDVKPRKFGNTKYTPISLFELALKGITSFSITPLRFVTFFGFVMSFLCFLLGVSAIVDTLLKNNVVPGWATIVVAIGFIGCVQMLCLGVIAEYLGQLFQEVKARPRYIIEEKTNK